MKAAEFMKLMEGHRTYRTHRTDKQDQKRRCAPCGGEAALLKMKAASATPAQPMDLILRSVLSAGDAVVMSAAVRDLHLAYPGRFRTVVESCEGNQLFLGNPYVVPAEELTNPTLLTGDLPDDHPRHFGYPAIQQCNQRRMHFIGGYIERLNKALGLSIPLTRFGGDLHLTEDERATRPVEQPYWLILAGGKRDYSAKVWPQHRWQQVVEMLRGRVQFVQAGGSGHDHPPLDGVIDVRGKTTLRQLAQLVYHSDGVACGITGAMHMAAAFGRPCVVVAGGREPYWWEAYTDETRQWTMEMIGRIGQRGRIVGEFVPHVYLHREGGYLHCAHGGEGCWKSRVWRADEDPKEVHSQCAHLRVERGALMPECLARIEPEEVAAGVLGYKTNTTHRTYERRPRLHFLANMVCEGGGEKSSLELMRRLRERFEVHFWPLTGIHEKHRVPVFNAVDVVHRDWKDLDIGAGEHVVVYCNDWPGKADGPVRQPERWRQWLGAAASVQLVINFVCGGLQKQMWLAKNLTCCYFLNSTKESEWRKHVAGTVLQGVPTVVLPPPTDLTPMLSTQRNIIYLIGRPEMMPLVISRLGGAAHKLPEDAIRFYWQLAERCPTAEFWFMPAPENLRAEFARHLRFRFFKRDEMPVAEFLGKSDIFCYPVRASVHDQGPRVIMEAMAAGCAVVAEDRDGPRDRIKPEETGLLAKTPDEMVEQVVRLARDPELRQRLGAAAREAARAMTPERWVEEIVGHSKRGAQALPGIGLIGQIGPITEQQAQPLESSSPAVQGAALPGLSNGIGPIGHIGPMKDRSTARYLVHIRGGQGLGNCLAMIPAIKALAAMGDVDLWLEPYSYAPLFRAEGYIRTVATKAEDLPMALEQYDAIVPIGYFSGVPGYKGRNVVPQQPADRWKVSEVEADMARVRALGYMQATPGYRLEMRYGQPEIAGRYMVIANCSRSSAEWRRKRWPYYAELAERFADAGLRVVCVGMAHDAEHWMADYEDRCGKTTIGALAGILQHAEIVVGNDCGVAHLAAALGAPTVMLFGPTSDVKNGVPGATIIRSDHPCQCCQGDRERYRTCGSAECLKALHVDKVWTTCGGMLGLDKKREARASATDMDNGWIERAIVDGNRRILHEDAELLLRACDATQAKNILEIGSMDGGSTIILGVWAGQHGAHLYAIEPKVKARLRENIVKWGIGQQVTVIPESSPWVSGVNIPALDVLFIDGCHLTRAALVDYHYWEPRLRMGGIVIFHDWCGRKGVQEQVRRAVEIVLETDGPGVADVVREQRGPTTFVLEEFGRVEAGDRGSIGFVKKGM